MQNLQPNPPENFPQAPLKKEILPSVNVLPAPDNPPWNSISAFFVWLASIVFIIIVPSIAVLIYVAASGFSFKDPAGLAAEIEKDPMAILVNIIAIIPAHILTLVLAWVVVTNAKKHSFREMLGWQWNGFKFWHVPVIIIGFFLLAYLLTLALGEQETDLEKILRSSRWVVYVVAFLATFTAPLVEEVIYRGILYSAFQRTFGVSVAVILVTILFAAVHVPQYRQSYATIILICLLSLVLTLIRARTGNLLPCIALHTVFNGIQSLALIAEPFLREQIKQSSESALLLFYLFK